MNAGGFDAFNRFFSVLVIWKLMRTQNAHLFGKTETSLAFLGACGFSIDLLAAQETVAVASCASNLTGVAFGRLENEMSSSNCRHHNCRIHAA